MPATSHNNVIGIPIPSNTLSTVSVFVALYRFNTNDDI